MDVCERSVHDECKVVQEAFDVTTSPCDEKGREENLLVGFGCLLPVWHKTSKWESQLILIF